MAIDGITDEQFDETRLVDVVAFGHQFHNFPAGLAQDLITLEREGAIYSHFADEAKGPDENDLWEFRYYRIQLTPPEVFQYVEAQLAYQEFHDAHAAGASFEAALDAISDSTIAERVRGYHDGGRSRLKDGTIIDLRGCAASFYPPGMEALLCGRRRDRYEELVELGTARDRLALVMQVLNNFPLSARLLENRQRDRAAFEMTSEYDAQDLLYAILRCVFEDAKREEWTPQRAGSAKRIDIVIPSIDVVIEVKFVRSSSHARNVADELRVDFECYHDRPECKHLVALVLDPKQHLADPSQFSDDLSGLRQKNGHSFEVSVLVR
jgi:REase_DpnII-MboI